MKILQITILALCAIVSFPVEAKTKSVNVEIPGTLEQLICADEMPAITDLKISGTLNSVDIRILRHLCGSDSAFKAVTPSLKLKHLDLSDVNFSVDTVRYAKGSTKSYRITGSHTLPEFMFYGCAIENATLPLRLDSVGYGALAFCELRSIDIPDGVYVHSTAVHSDSSLVTLRVPAMENGIAPSSAQLPRLKSVTYSDMGYMMSGAFKNLTDIEEIIFDGMVGHIDGYTVSNCPNLKRVIFRGAVNTTGGPQFVENCPQLEEVRFDGLVIAMGFTEPVNCPKLKGYTIGGVVVDANDTTCTPLTPIADIVTRPDMMKQLTRLVDWQVNAIHNARGFLRKTAFSTTKQTLAMAEAAGLTELQTKIKEAIEYANGLEDLRPKLDILKASPEYKAVSDTTFSFSYAQPSDSLLTLSRQHFNLDSIAGNGDDISRIKNLLYWVHDLVRHDGSSQWPDCRFNLRELAQVCHDENRGVNCRFMAMMLTEALLAEGIPARYLTCESKAWNSDTDCHVICVAWSESLNKWVWVDPTFAAFVTDENGLMLHPGEVRYRLQHDLPLAVNKDANWNHKSDVAKEYYLDEYMAKNLYIISCNTINQAEPEGRTSHPKGKGVALVPVGSNYTNAHFITTDYEQFWQSPQ